MTNQRANRRILNDWFDGELPGNIDVAPDALIETAFSFTLFRNESPKACTIGSGSAVYLGTMLDTGRGGRIRIGQFVTLNGPRIICDGEIEIGDYSLVAWGVVIMDSYRIPFDLAARRCALREAGRRGARSPSDQGDARPVYIGSNVWIGFDSCVLPGVCIGDGAVIGAKSVVVSDIPSNCLAAGNPARVVRTIHAGDARG
jgi:acetyltransferase-like isoleucine patch superfamily enzyme